MIPPYTSYYRCLRRYKKVAGVYTRPSGKAESTTTLVASIQQSRVKRYALRGIFTAARSLCPGTLFVTPTARLPSS